MGSLDASFPIGSAPCSHRTRTILVVPCMAAQYDGRMLPRSFTTGCYGSGARSNDPGVDLAAAGPAPRQHDRANRIGARDGTFDTQPGVGLRSTTPASRATACPVTLGDGPATFPLAEVD